jgi:hypothetical protein
VQPETFLNFSQADSVKLKNSVDYRVITELQVPQVGLALISFGFQRPGRQRAENAEHPPSFNPAVSFPEISILL